MAKYYIGNKTIVLTDEESGYSVFFSSETPSYSLANYLITNNKIQELDFFTKVGYRLTLSRDTPNDTVFESTRTRCLNIYTKDDTWATTPIMYDDIINSIIKIYHGDKISIDQILISFSKALVDIKHYIGIPNTEIVSSNVLAGNYILSLNKILVKNKYSISLRTGAVRHISTDSNVCINILTNDFKSSEMSEKELSILGKILYCLNDEVFFKKDEILGKFV